MEYIYYDLKLGRERTAQKALADHLQAVLGAKAVGVFAPMLGFASNEILVLTDASAAPDAVAKAPGVVLAERHRLSPTIRPQVTTVSSDPGRTTRGCPGGSGSF